MFILKILVYVFVFIWRKHSDGVQEELSYIKVYLDTYSSRNDAVKNLLKTYI